MNNSIQILVSLIILMPFISASQPFKAVPISLAQGLSQSSVYDIEQDQSGYVWMATQDGLNRYDGRTFKVFREEPFDSTSISSNFINDILVDSKNRLWIGTANEGLNLFIPGKEIFYRYDAGVKSDELNNNIITHLHEDKKGRIWVGTGGGLFQLIENETQDPSKYSFENIILNTSEKDSTPDKYISVIQSDKYNRLWVGTFAGLFQVNVSSDQISAYETFYLGNPKSEMHKLHITTLTIDQRDRIWVGGRNGISVYDKNSEKLYELNTESAQQTGMVSNMITTLYTDSYGNVWIGYYQQGIQMAVVNSENGIVKFSLPSVSVDAGMLSNGHAASIMEDQITKGIMWFGFNAGGVVKMVPVSKHFETNHLTKADLPNSFVVNILKEDKDKIWIGTYSGLVKFSRDENKYQNYLPSKISKGKSDVNNITGLVKTKEGNILFGSGNQLYIIKNKNGTEVLSYIPLPESNTSYRDNLRAIYTDKSGTIYLILRLGVYIFDPVSETFTQKVIFSDDNKLNDKGFFISTCLVDASDNFWLGTSSGLYLYPPDQSIGTSEKTFHSYYHSPSDTTSLRNQNVLGISEDNNGDIWVGTMNGLSKVIRTNGKTHFINYSTKNGLNNNVVYSILSDNKTGHLWLSTNNGLTEFHPDGYVISNYDVSDGLQSNEFNSYAAYKADDGEMFFGGINGYTSFYPEKILTDNTKPIVFISGLTLNGHDFINLTDYQKSKTIDLKYSDNSFSVDFTGIHYVDPQRVQFAYLLEGFQDDWIYSGTSSTVNFSQLPPGRYVFRVKAANSDGVFNEVGDMFIINIKPPFYKTVWFYLLIALFVAGVIYGLFKYRLSMKMQQVKEVEKIRRATAADFHDELGHKLTIISWFAEILKKKIGPEQADLRPHLDKIIEASGNLYHTMKDMLWAMDPDKDSIYDLYNQIKEFGLELFDNTGIEFEASDIPASLKENIISPAHKRHVLLIFKEVMHNSLKHAHGSSTNLELVRQNGHLKFRFRDNGSGFTMNGNGTGRGLENVKRRANQINAVIDIHSEKTGTVTELELSVAQLN